MQIMQIEPICANTAVPDRSPSAQSAHRYPRQCLQLWIIICTRGRLFRSYCHYYFYQVFGNKKVISAIQSINIWKVYHMRERERALVNNQGRRGNVGMLEVEGEGGGGWVVYPLVYTSVASNEPIHMYPDI